MLQTINGSYLPSFFQIYLETDKDESHFLDKEFLPTICHEYLHFTQDICTVYGLINISNVFCNIADFYLNKESKIIRLPYKTENGLRMLNTNLFHIYFNKSPYKYVEKKDCISFTDYVLPIGTSKLCNYYLLIKCTDGNTYPVQFGACAILEGMARILENHLYPSPDNGRWQIPYDLPYLFANTVLPEFAIKQENIFALCDISLQMYNPAEVFYNLLYIMKDEHFISSDLESFYNYSYSKIEKMYKIKFTDIWNKSVEDARYNLKNAVNLPECQYAVTWADNVIETYTQKRDSDKVFLSRFMSMDRATAEVEYFKLIREVVSPIIYNKKNQYSIMIDHQEDAPLDIDQLAYWIHISRMYNYIYTKNCNCPYDDICTEECNDRTNPLRHSDICLFTQYGRNFGLNHKKVLKP